MELLKDIYFNTDKLVENTNVKISYTGKFYQGNDEKVYIHYGYGKNWDNIQDVEMKKTDLGYQTELSLSGNETINFCFKNQNNEWDNNNGKDYIFNIEKASQNELGRTTVGQSLLDSFEIQPLNNVISDLYDKTPNSNVYFKAEIDSIYNKPVYNDIVTPTAQELNTIVNPVSELTSNSAETPANTEVKLFSLKEFMAAENLGIPSLYDFDKKTSTQPVTSMTVANSNSQSGWKKFKASIIKFFTSVPKLITGNYKRSLNKK